MEKLYALLLLLVSFNMINAQESNSKYLEFGIEAQRYPTGYLTGLRAELGLTLHHALDFRIGYNGLDHEDFGVHDSEIGGGFGGSIGYRYYFKPERENWFLGLRTDLWFNEIDWKDFAPNTSELIEASTTDVYVLQPTLIGGYRWAFHEHFALTPTVAVGAEINIITNGENVGQGPIFLLGLNFTYRL